MTYYVNFYGYCEVKANSAKEAEDEFWEYIYNRKFPPEAVFDCEGVEQKEEN